MKSKVTKPYLEAADLGLDEWLALVFAPERDRKFTFTDYEFPSDDHTRAYIDSISTRSDEEVKALLRYFLIPSGSLGHDRVLLRHWIDSHNLVNVINTMEFGRRLIRGQPWEGITWILDLLPHWPKAAVDALDAYFLAHAQVLPDGRFRGLSDALAIIRAKYLALIQPRDVLISVSPREFEFLTAALYRKKGYRPKVTRQSQDGGVDIICERERGLSTERVFIECKHHIGTIGVRVIRQLAGVISEQGATRGVVVTSSQFTKSAIDFSRGTGRVGLLDFEGLNKEMNEHLGPLWAQRLSELVAREQREQTIDANKAPQPEGQQRPALRQSSRPPAAGR